MELHLNYTPTPSPEKISHTDNLMLVGSCFAENIGEKLLQNKFKVSINPNGILFNPISICNALLSYIHNSKIDSNLIVKSNDLFYSLDYHGSFSSTEENSLYSELTHSQQQAHFNLKECKILIITFGSAYVYRQIKTEHIVANCHKLPQKDFKKELLPVDTIVSAYNSLIDALQKFNPNLQILLTVSPVKYLRDGIIENNLSKSILIQSVHELIRQNKNCSYFPAYELVTDDLRDYRFYKADMAHPNEQAINYVWEKFSDCYFTENTKQLNRKISDIATAASHRPIHSETEAHKVFKRTYLSKCLQLEKEFSFLDLTTEKQIFH